MSEMGQKAKYSLRADVIRFAPDSGHVATAAAFPFCAKTGSRGLSCNVQLRFVTWSWASKVSVAMLKRPKSSLFHQPIFGHPKRDYDALTAPVAGN
jgi:hypothetical protein